MFRVALLEFRKNILSWASIPLAISWSAIALLRAQDWNGSWLSAVSYTSTTTAFMLAPVGAIVGLESSRRRANRFDEHVDVSCRSRTSITAMRLAVFLAAAFSPAALALATVSIVNFGSAASVHIVGLDQIAYASSMLILTCTLSFAAGMITPTPVAGAALGLLVGVLLGFFGDIPLSTAPDVRLASSRIILAAAISALAIGAVLLTTWISTFLSFERSATTLRVASTGLVVAGLAVAINAPVIAGDLRVGNPPPAEASCSDTRPRVCVWPDHENYLPELGTMAQRAERAIGSELKMPAVFREFGLTPGRNLTYAFVIQGESNLDGTTAGGLASTVLNTSLLEDYCEPRSQAAAKKRSDLVATLQYWLHARVAGGPENVSDGGNASVGQEGRRVLRMPEGVQRQWVARTTRSIRAIPCAVSADSKQ